MKKGTPLYDFFNEANKFNKNAYFGGKPNWRLDLKFSNENFQGVFGPLTNRLEWNDVVTHAKNQLQSILIHFNEIGRHRRFTKGVHDNALLPESLLPQSLLPLESSLHEGEENVNVEASVHDRDREFVAPGSLLPESLLPQSLLPLESSLHEGEENVNLEGTSTALEPSASSSRRLRSVNANQLESSANVTFDDILNSYSGEAEPLAKALTQITRNANETLKHYLNQMAGVCNGYSLGAIFLSSIK